MRPSAAMRVRFSRKWFWRSTLPAFERPLADLLDGAAAPRYSSSAQLIGAGDDGRAAVNPLDESPKSIAYNSVKSARRCSLPALLGIPVCHSLKREEVLHYQKIAFELVVLIKQDVVVIRRSAYAEAKRVMRQGDGPPVSGREAQEHHESWLA